MLRWLVFPVVGLLCLPLFLHADERTRETLIFNISPGGYPPYTILDEDGAVSGIMWDILSGFAEHENLELEAREIPPRRVDAFLREGRVDVTMRAREWASTPEEFLFSAPVLRIRDVVVSPAHSPREYQGSESLNGLTVLAQLGFHYPIFDELVAEDRVERFDVQQARELFRRLREARRFDAAIADYYMSQWMIRQNGWGDELYVSERPLSEVQYRFMFGRDRSDTVAALDEYITRIRSTGELQQIRDAYQ